MSDMLVAYFSRSGVTERLARELAAKLGADLEPIKPVEGYLGVGGFLKGMWHSLFRYAPQVDRRRDPANYAVVIIGSPVWAGRLSAPMRGYLTRFRGRTGLVAAFCVSGSGRPYKEVFAEIDQLTGCTVAPTASFSQREVIAGAADAKLEMMAKALRILPREAA